MIITEVNSLVDLVTTATNFAAQLQDGWYKGSAEVEMFQDQVLMLCDKHDQWSAQLQRHGLSEDKRLLRAVQAAVQVLDKQQQYVTRLQKNRLFRWRKKAFPGLLSHTLERVLAIVDAGPQLLAGRVATHDILERSGAQAPAPLPFVHDPKYVPISQSIVEIEKALETAEGSRVVTVHGEPGLGKSSAAKYLALRYAEETNQWLHGTRSGTPTFPDGVYYLFCGQEARGRVNQLQLELIECLGFGASSSAAPNDLMAGGAQEGKCFQQPSPHIQLRSRLLQQKLLIILDDLWQGDVLEQLLVPAQGVKYLVTSQMTEIWGAADKIQLKNPTQAEARHIMANYTEGLPTKGTFPDSIQGVTDDIIRKSEFHPLSLANVGISINRRRVNDESHWKAISDNFHGVLDKNDLQGSPVIYERTYSLPVGASMMLMVESLLPEARRLLFLIALLGGERLPETLVRFFYRVLQGVEKPDFLLRYNNEEKYLEDRSLVTLNVRGNELNESMLAAHNLRTHYIRQSKTVDLQSIACQVMLSSDQGVELIRNGDAEETLVTVLSAMYYERSFTSVVLPTLENHLRIINEGVIPRSINNDIDILEFVKRGRRGVQDFVFLLNNDHGGPAWKQQAHECAKKIIVEFACQGKFDDDSMGCMLQLPRTTSKIIIKLACQGKLDDCSMAGLLQLPQTTSIACRALSMVCYMRFVFLDQNDTFSSAHPTTMKALLGLVNDDATSTTRRVAAVTPLLEVLAFDRKDVILEVGTRLTELLAMDSNPTLQIAIAKAIEFPWTYRKKTGIMICTWTEILEVLIGFLVSGKDYDLLRAAGKTLLSFSRWTSLALKIAIIPDALAKLFTLFSSKTAWHALSSVAGRILATLASVSENRSKFRGWKGSVEGLGDILVTLGVTWRATHKTEDLKDLEARASVAAGILGELALDEELKEVIASLPGLEEGLLFLHFIQMARFTASSRRPWYKPILSTKALTILFLNPVNSRARGIPTTGELEACLSEKGLPSKLSWMADVYVNVYWTRVLVHLETRAYRAALENLDLAQNHLPCCQDGDDRGVIQVSSPWWEFSANGYPATKNFRNIRIFCLGMLKDYGGALSATNTMLGKNPWPEGVKRATVRRAIVKRLSGDSQGALDDFNLVLPSIMEDSREDAYDALKNRGYVKYLMGDDAGARQDAEAAQQLKLDYEIFEETIDLKRLWSLQKQPINYLGYSL